MTRPGDARDMPDPDPLWAASELPEPRFRDYVAVWWRHWPHRNRRRTALRLVAYLAVIVAAFLIGIGIGRLL